MARKTSKRQPQSMPLTPESLLRLFKDAKQPLSRAEIQRRMNLRKADKRPLKDLLRDLMQEGKLIRIRRAYGLAGAMNLVSGRLEMTRSGMGFVIPDDVRRSDIFIHQKNMGGAWHGDRVSCAIMSERSGRKSAEGRIVRVLERGRDLLPVKVLKPLGDGDWAARPTDPKLDFGMIVTAPQGMELQRGDIAQAEPGEQLDRFMWEGELVEKLGPESDVRVQEALVKSNNNIRTRFQSDVLAEAEVLPAVPSEEDFRGREDLRHIPFVTIDGETARDFDDAVFVERSGKGYRLWVAIADVAHYVPEGSALDREALERGNSYYFPLSVEPMFPEKLSNGLCSLNPHVPRLSMGVVMEMSEKGVVKESRMFAAVIESHARLTYTQIKDAILDRKPEARAGIDASLLPMLELCEELARKINKLRSLRGSLDFELPEPKADVDEDGHILGIHPAHRHFGHQIIEEFMIAANEAVARYLVEEGLPCMFRIHPEADAEKLANLFRFLHLTDPDIERPKSITPKALQELIRKVAGSPREFVVNRLLLRSMKQAKYSPVNEGHFGLASECYCHFTSPIRRYADLMVHRLVKTALGTDDAPLNIPGGKKMTKVAGNLSGRERTAMDAEREIYKRLSVLYMRSKVGKTFMGVISQIMDFGFRIELKEEMAEGIIRLSSLDDDYYAYWPHREMLVGERTGRAFTIGQEVEVMLEYADLERLELNFVLQSVVAAAMDYKDLV
ncbi:ribonuclease R [Salidesulfovibrio onnuriiensis]|uniref:ribonuclease R n=1 Tax=Salidesulfovibrio onnuriiensis TaxID=2583823 RepID=UPI0011CABE25|nr:ribonuclease R [Salidesulfovibrio onnuriiensis]